MGVKRATNRIDPERMERAVDLRLQGRQLREIEAETGISIAALSTNLRVHPRIVEAEGAPEIEDEAAREDCRSTAQAAHRAIRALCRQVEAQAKRGEADTRAASGIAAALEKAIKYERLLAGKPTSHAKSERAPAEPQLTPEERAALDGLADAAKLS